MGKLLKQLFIALGQALWYRLTYLFGHRPLPAIVPDGQPLRIDLGCGTN